jgi:hypothetical protein
MGQVSDAADSASDAAADASDGVATSEGVDMTRTMVSMWPGPLGSVGRAGQGVHDAAQSAHEHLTPRDDSPHVGLVPDRPTGDASAGERDARPQAWAQDESVTIDHGPLTGERPGHPEDAGPEAPEETDSPEQVDQAFREAEARKQVNQAARARDISQGRSREQWDRSLQDHEPLALTDAQLEPRTSPDRLFLADDVTIDLNGADLPHRRSGYLEVVIHGDREGQFEARLDRPDGTIERVALSPEQLARVIESGPAWNDRPVVLSSCWSAESGAEMAERLGVAVYAPSSALDITAAPQGLHPDGSVRWGSVRLEPMPGGKWVRFEPSWSRAQ